MRLRRCVCHTRYFCHVVIYFFASCLLQAIKHLCFYKPWIYLKWVCTGTQIFNRRARAATSLRVSATRQSQTANRLRPSAYPENVRYLKGCFPVRTPPHTSTLQMNRQCESAKIKQQPTEETKFKDTPNTLNHEISWRTWAIHLLLPN